MSLIEHRKRGPETASIGVITVSDTRTAETDKSGGIIKEILLEDNHSLIAYSIVRDDETHIVEAFQEMAADENMDAIIINGGTGLAKRDVTIEAISAFFEKDIVGFGELFRFLSYQEDIGSAAILSRAAAGTYNQKAVFIIPGSTGAVKLAMKKLILPEISHIIFELRKDK
ncbi:MogA/MoaB family molybdenum cofactor biosynthesis protein [Falsibacillus albus]|uniref:Molybdenum cofactor biosynthesis protein B n=1 Tax=Falsibacillus albus TaxID=2478915 RepID=A0A3L7K717_9BACI|nr:MogA/MoaB family molybdenum cofactor biosynthesis protein [Falsibacillus albus]RLQ97941.1 MogA/MoaB family molybdenum cofactor biosynthesis protein [Falsibacillus albus]